MLPQTLHGRSAVALLLPAAAPLQQYLLRGAFRWDGTTLWFEWYAGGFPLPFDLTRLDRAVLPRTPEMRGPILENGCNCDVESALFDVEFCCSCWVTAAPPEATPAPGMVAVADSPRASDVVITSRWTESD